MKSSILAIACIFVTLGMTLAANYGSYAYPSYGYPSYGGGYGAQSSGVGQGGLLMLLGFLVLILLLTNSSIFNSTSTTTTSPTVTLIGG